MPSHFHVHGSLVLGQILFGCGSVIAALGLPACHPLVFALYRELGAGILLGLLAWAFSNNSNNNNNNNNSGSSEETATTSTTTKSDTTSADPIGGSDTDDDDNNKGKGSRWHTWRRYVRRDDVVRFAFLGLMIFGNQACMIVGIKLAGPIAAAVWQPSQPILTVALEMALGLQPWHLGRVLGILGAFVGCAVMVLTSAKATAPTAVEDSSSFRHVLGHVCFFINCSCSSLYFVFSKPILRRYASLWVTAGSYQIAALFMAITTLLTAPLPSLQQLLCPECQTQWQIPPGAYGALAYWIVGQSVAAYGMLTWANQFVTGTLVLGYSVLQPVTTAFLTVVLLTLRVYPYCAANTGRPCLDPPTGGAFVGMIGIVAGLGVLVQTEPAATSTTSRVERKSEQDEADEDPLLPRNTP